MVKVVKNSNALASAILLAFFVFLPFERLLTLEVFGLTLKSSYLLLMLLVACLLSRKAEKNRLAFEEKLLLIFAGVSYLSVFWSIDQFRSMIVATIFFSVFLGFFALRRFFNQELIEKVEVILIWSGILLALFALWQYFADLYNLSRLTFLRPAYDKSLFGFPRPQATFLEPLYFANYLFLPLYISIKRALRSNHLVILPLVATFLVTAALTLTLSRGAYFGFLVSLAVLVIWSAIRFPKIWRKMFVPLGIVVAGFIAAVVMIKITAPPASFNLFILHAGVADINSNGSTLDRLYLTRRAWQEFVRHPWGIGAGAFGALPEFSQQLISGNYQTVNNLYLEILVEEGIAGLLLFVSFLVLLFKALSAKIKAGNHDALIYLSIGVAIFVQATSFSTLYILPIWAYLALAWWQASD